MRHYSAARIEITAVINEGTVSVDAASLMNDLAGDGLDTALKEKHTQVGRCKLKPVEPVLNAPGSNA